MLPHHNAPKPISISASLKAGALYFVLVFAAGFVLGTIRTLWIIPAAGEFLATLIELPLILGLAWMACRWVLQRIPVPPEPVPRLLMGAGALALLLTAEALLSISLGGLTLAEHMGLYAKFHVQLGLAAQVAYALFPWVQGRTT